MTRNIEVRVNPMRKDRERQDHTRQLKLLVKVGYESLGRFRVIKRYEVKILKGREIYRVTDKEYHDLRNKVSDESLRIFGKKQKIKQLILQAFDNDQEITADIIHRKLYQIENDEEEKRKQVGWNDLLAQWGVEVNKEEIEELEKEIEIMRQKQDGFITDEDIGDVAAGITMTNSLKREHAMLKKMDYNTRYKNGHYDRNNIFDVFGFLWSENPLNGDPYVPKSYRSLILVLNDYRINGLPSPSTRDFNSKWIDGFFTYLVQNGYPDVRLKGYNPFNIQDYYERLKNAKRKPYKVQSFEKTVKHFKRYLALLKEHELIKYSKEVELISASKYISRNVTKDMYTKKEFSLNPHEYETLASTDFKDDRLNLARDMFIIMVQGGGFRTSEMFEYVKVQSNEITVYRPKTQEVERNPIWGHMAEVVNRHEGIPKSLLPIEDYRLALKEIAEYLNLNRVIVRPNTRITNKKPEEIAIEDKVEELIIKDIFNPEFARRTLVTYLSHVKQLKDEDIISFTSHSDPKTLKHYKSSRTVIEKTRLIE